MVRTLGQDLDADGAQDWNASPKLDSEMHSLGKAWVIHAPFQIEGDRMSLVSHSSKYLPSPMIEG